jgi:oligoribonuclease
MTKNLLWIDLEMSGLDEKQHKILEVAVIITDLNLEVLHQYDKVVFQPPEVLEAMDEWCKKTHSLSGLTKAVEKGTSLSQVENEVVAIINQYWSDNKVILAGNSVGNDKRFIDAHMPKLASRLHYRIVDVSSFKEIFRSKFNIQFKKGNQHRALDDIVESINELKHYLSFIKQEEGST